METLIVDRDEGVVTVTMNRPERKNAANGVMLTELRDTFEAVERNAEDRVLVLTGAGGAFCSGADLGDPDGPASNTAVPGLIRMRRLGDVALALHRLTKPAIAKVDGVAVGAGFSLALGCDLVVASERARLSMIFSRRGLSLDNGASWLLPRLIGHGPGQGGGPVRRDARRHEARGLGLVNRVVPVDELDEFVAGWARTLAAGPPLALSMTKMLLNDSFRRRWPRRWSTRPACQAVNFETDDTAEAMAAFKEKREPRFVGR